MIISVTGNGVTILEPDNFTRFHIATMIAREGLSTVLRTSGFGTVDPDGTAVLDIDVVESAGRSVSDDPTWDTGWSTMIAYARSKEWVTADGRGVRAHVEYESSTDETP